MHFSSIWPTLSFQSRNLQTRKTTQSGCKVRWCTKMRIVFSSIPTWAQDVCVKREISLSCLLYQAVMWPLCNYGSTSTPCVASRSVPRCAEKNSKIHACWIVSIVWLIQSNHTRIQRFPLSFVATVPFATWTRLAHLSTHTKHWSQSVESLASRCFRSNMSLGFTSVLTDDIVGSLRKAKSWVNKLINVTMCKMSFPHENVPWCVSRHRSSHQVSMQVSSGRDSVHVPIKYLNTFLARVKSASVGDASVYDKHFVANIKSGLTPVMHCSFPTTALNNKCWTWSHAVVFIVQIQTLPFRQRRHHCLCVLQLNNVPTFVNVLGSRFHCESSAVTIVYTSALESQATCSCHHDSAHESDVLVLGSDKLSPRYHRHVDVVLAYLWLLCKDDLANIDQFSVLGSWACCRYTRGHFKRTHGDVLNAHTEGLSLSSLFPPFSLSLLSLSSVLSLSLSLSFSLFSFCSLFLFLSSLSSSVVSKRHVPDSSNHSLYLTKLSNFNYPQWRHLTTHTTPRAPHHTTTPQHNTPAHQHNHSCRLPALVLNFYHSDF